MSPVAFVTTGLLANPLPGPSARAFRGSMSVAVSGAHFERGAWQTNADEGCIQALHFDEYSYEYYLRLALTATAGKLLVRSA